VLALVMIMLGGAYRGIYPRLTEKTIVRMIRINLALTALALSIVASVYAGSGIAFSLIVFDVPWWLFTLIAAGVLETPLFVWFCARWDIEL